MNILIIVLRLLHIFAGVFWAGAIFFLVSFLQPTAKLLGPESAKFMQTLARNNRLTIALVAAGTLNVLAGVTLYIIISGGLNGAWIASGTGLSLGIGGLFGIAALSVGIRTGRANMSMMQLGQTFQTQDRPPSPEQLASMQALQARAANLTITVAVLLSFTLIGMSIAQYL